MATKKSTKSSFSETDLLASLIKPSDRQVILDTETTGLSARNGDRLVEIGLVEVIDRQITGRKFHTYINPKRSMPPEAQAVHGLSEEFLKDKPTFKEVAKDFLKFVEGADVVIHNAPFDVGFLNFQLEELGLGKLEDRVLRITDTLAIAKTVWQGKKNSLDALCDRLGIDRSGRVLHGALLDAEILADVYITMGRGQNSLLLSGGADAGQLKQKNATGELTDFSKLNLPVIKPSEEELAAHWECIRGFEKQNGCLSLYSILDRGLDPKQKYDLEGKLISTEQKSEPPPKPEAKPENNNMPFKKRTDFSQEAKQDAPKKDVAFDF